MRRTPVEISPSYHVEDTLMDLSFIELSVSFVQFYEFYSIEFMRKILKSLFNKLILLNIDPLKILAEQIFKFKVKPIS